MSSHVAAETKLSLPAGKYLVMIQYLYNYITWILHTVTVDTHTVIALLVSVQAAIVYDTWMKV